MKVIADGFHLPGLHLPAVSKAENSLYTSIVDVYTLYSQLSRVPSVWYLDGRPAKITEEMLEVELAIQYRAFPTWCGLAHVSL